MTMTCVLEHADREFDCGAGAVEGGVLFERRHQIGDVADDEKFAGTHVEHHRRVDAAVRTRDDQRLRPLAALRQGLEPLTAAGPNGVTEAPIAAD
jgi:hypothetical protein